MIAAIDSHSSPSPTATAAKRPAPATRPTPIGEFAAFTKLGRSPSAETPEATRDTAAKLLSQLFFAPMLAEMRKLPFGQKFATGGRTEAIFGEQLYVRLADAVGASGAGGVTQQIASRLAGPAKGATT